MRLPLIYLGSAITAFGFYRTYAFLKKERQMSAFLERHPMAGGPNTGSGRYYRALITNSGPSVGFSINQSQ